MKTFSKGDIAKSEIAKTGVKERLPGQTGRAKLKEKLRRASQSGAVVIENFKTFHKLKNLFLKTNRF